MKIHFFMISLCPFKQIQVSGKFFRRLSSSRDLTLHKRLVLFLHQPHLKGWQRVHHSASSIRERWHICQSTSFHIRGVQVSIRVSREILRGFMNIMIWRTIHISIILRFPCKTDGLARWCSYEDFDPFEEFDPCEEFGPYEDLDPYEEFGPYEEFDLGFLFFTGGVMMTFTWRFSRHLLGTQIFFIGGLFL